MASRLSFHASKTKVYSVLLGAVVIVGIVVLIVQWSKKHRDDFKEHFTSGNEEDYNSRLTVIDVFDAFLKRNPTPAEITKYSVYKNEQDILMAVMKDYPNEVEKNQELVYKNNQVVQEEEFYVDALDTYDPTKEEEKTPTEEAPKDKITMTMADMIALRKHLNNAFMVLNKYTMDTQST
jgi:hypothetical protein